MRCGKREAGFHALFASAGIVAVDGASVATERAPGAPGPTMCEAALPAL